MANQKSQAKAAAKEAAIVAAKVGKEFASIGGGVISELLKLATLQSSSSKKK